MPLPEKGTKEWENEVKFYLSANRDDLLRRAEQLNYANITSYMNMMERRGIYRGKSQNIPKIESTEGKVFLPPIPKIEISPLKTEHDNESEGEEVFVALISDIHGGLRTPTYNSKVFKERLELYKKFIINTCLLHRKMRPIKKLVLPFLGDIVQGQQIGIQMLVEECEIIGAEDQIYDLLLPEFANFTINLLQLFEEIEIYGIEGNHGNINRRRETLTKCSNWDTIFYRALKASLIKYKQIKVDPELETWWKVIKINHWNFFMTHLDQIQSYQGIPFYGISRKGLRWKQSIPQDFDYILGAHFHNPNYLYNDGVPTIINGSFVSDSDFPLVRMGLKDVSRQVCFFVNRKYGITALYQVQLDYKQQSRTNINDSQD